jgi:LmbE family N-acetylglucosaminyl deacetylase
VAEEQLRIMVIGAHPDDADIKAGGTAAKWCALGHVVRFEPHVVVDIEQEFDRLVAMLHCHQSQFYEWLPYNAGYPGQVPAGEAERRLWLAERVGRHIRPLADRYRARVIDAYGPERGSRVRYIEAFEVSEYGAAG